MFVSRVAAWGATMMLIIGACSSSEQPAQPEPASQEQAAAPQEQAAAPPEKITTKTDVAVQKSTSGEAEKMAATNNLTSSESKEKMAVQETPPDEQMETESKMSLGPNMTRVHASVVEVEEKGNSYYCTLNIEQILGSGPSTPTLVRGNEIIVRIKKVVGQSEKLASKGGKVEVMLQHALPMASIQPPPPAWNVLEVY